MPATTRSRSRSTRRAVIPGLTALALVVAAVPATAAPTGSGDAAPTGSALGAGPPGLEPRLVPPVLLRHLDLREHAEPDAFYRPQLQFGDLDGDGRHTDFVRYANSTRMQAFRYSGGDDVELLWDYAAPVELPPPPDRYQYKYTLWDVDSDGRTEVVGPFATASGTVELRVLDGLTGAVEHVVATDVPNPVSDDRVDEWRLKVTVADVRGLGHPSDIVLLTENNSYGDLYVYTDDLTPLWDTTGDNSPESGGSAAPGGEGGKDRIYAHYPWNADIDGDGRDEFIGTWALDDDGSRMFRITPPEWEEFDYFYDHVDRAFVGDLDRRPGEEILVSHEFLEAALLSSDGTVRWTRPNVDGDAKLTAVGNFTLTNPGFELPFLEPLSDTTGLLDIDDELLRSVPRVRDGYPIDWDGDRRVDELFVPRSGGISTPWNGAGIELEDDYDADRLTPYAEGMRLYAHALDLVGDFREEVVIVDEDEVLVYGAAGRARGHHRSPWHDPGYREAIANTMNDNHPERPWFDWRRIGRLPAGGHPGR
ncbi:MAG: hypothetical protein ACFCVF_05780 [Kineosporiaceae bacterium]